MITQQPFVFFLRALAALFVSAVTSGPADALPVSGQITEEQRKICSEPIRQNERAAGIPNQLLAAVARAESGRWDKADSASFAWPWTVTAEGKGQFFSTKEEAIRHVKQLQGRGVRNIDVGCMQVNLMHHPKAFADIDEALDPGANVAYATTFLKQLFEQNRSWVVAVGNYHSATPEFHMRYRQKVMQLWNDERRRDAEARRQETIAAYQQRRLAAQDSARGRQMPMDSAQTDEDLVESDIPDTKSASLVSRLQQPAKGIVVAQSQSAAQPNSSLRVTSQIPPAPASPRPGAAYSVPVAPPAKFAAPPRPIPRSTMVPIERRY